MTKEDSSGNQTEISIGAFLAICEVGDEVLIRNTHGGVLSFVLTKVTEIWTGTKARYLYTEKGGLVGGNSWYRKSGRSARFPTGQAHIVQSTVLFAPSWPNIHREL